MACGDDMKTLLSRHVDGELSPEERATVEGHVATCAPCRELMDLFRKNESILSNALSTESFGNSVIESVIGQIKRDAAPVEAKPVEDGPLEWLRSRPFVQLAAAAVLVVGLVAVLTYSHERQMATLKARMDGQIYELSKKQQATSEAFARESDEHEKLIQKLRTEDAFRRAPEREALAFMTAQHLVIRASFDPKQYGSFAIYRRAESDNDDRYVKLVDRRLESPEYIDPTVKPGQGYVYKFRAYKSAKDEAYVESYPILMRVPKVQEPAIEKGIRVQCVDIAVNKKLAKFTLHRMVNGQMVSDDFLVKPGEAMGDLREIPGFGKVDFRTNLTLDRLEEGNQTLEVSYTTPELDAEGRPVMFSKNGNTVEVKTIQHEGVLSIRPNMRAFFRTTNGPADVTLWKGSSLQARAQD